MMLKSDLPLQADVFQMGHHGSSTSNSEAFLRKVQPKLAIYSAGVDNPYGHPHVEVVNRLKKLDIPMLGTDKSGTIILRTDGKGYEISTSK